MMKNFKDEPFFQNIEAQGKLMFGKKFQLYESDIEVLFKLKAYFTKDYNLSNEFEIDLDKGIYLAGPVGAGKTTLFKVFQHFTKNTSLHFRILYCNRIPIEHSTENNTLIRYAIRDFDEKTKSPRTKLFDDLGKEILYNDYGIQRNLIGEILRNRYDEFIDNKMITHITSNLYPSALENTYGTDIRSRVREMCNFIAFKKDALDKRK